MVLALIAVEHQKVTTMESDRVLSKTMFCVRLVKKHVSLSESLHADPSNQA